MRPQGFRERRPYLRDTQRATLLLLSSLLVCASAAQQLPAADSSGSAFAVGMSGELLTNDHVVKGCTDVSVIGRGGERLTARVIGRDVRNDLALFRVNTTLKSVAVFRRTPVRAGENVIALGFPLSGLLANDLNVSTGIISATAGLLNDTTMLQMSASVQSGNSGGPLLDASGSVVGVVVAKLDAIAVARATGDIPQNVNFAIKGEVAEIFLRSHGIAPQFIGESVKALPVPDIVDRARPLTFLVECRRSAPTVTRVEQPAARGGNAEGPKPAQDEQDNVNAAAERAAAVERAAAAERIAAAERARERRASERAQLWSARNLMTSECVKPADMGTLAWNQLTVSEQWHVCISAATIQLPTPGCTKPPDVGLLAWNRMSATEQSAACGSAGMTRGAVQVTDAGFVSQRIDFKKAAAGEYPNALVADERWISMYLRASGLESGDEITLTLSGPDGRTLSARKTRITPRIALDTILWVGRPRSGFTQWKRGLYTGRVIGTRRGVSILDFSAYWVME